jgi:hypothetical protein
MKFLSDVRLLILGLWLGASVFFIIAAQNAFAVVEQRELAGAIVGRNLAVLNISGLIVAVLLILLSLVGASRSRRSLVWVERVLLLIIGTACAVGQFVIGIWIGLVRQQIGRPIDELAADDPLRLQFNSLHLYSEWALMAAMIAGLIAFFIIANRRFNDGKAAATPDVYDFSKEFKI